LRITSGEGAQFLRYFGPLLDALRELGGSGTPTEVVERIATDLKLPDKLQDELLPSGGLRYPHQVAWARFYLAREGFIDSSRNGVWSLTAEGEKAHVAAAQARAIFDKWVRFDREQRKARGAASVPSLALPVEEPLPEGEIGPTQIGYRDQVLDLIKTLPPAGFEKLCQAILREAGFTEIFVTGRSGDQGIDGHGTLQINPLVSFKVLFQCKRYKESVSPANVRDFRGAMAGRADKGIILTTGSFTVEARREGSRDGVPPIELIDGVKLVDMLEGMELGLLPVKSFVVDGAFFNKFQN
jgi:restriction system protein